MAVRNGSRDNCVNFGKPRRTIICNVDALQAAIDSGQFSSTCKRKRTNQTRPKKRAVEEGGQC